MSGNFLSGCEGQEIVVALGVPGRREGDGPHGSCAQRIGWLVVVKNLDVGAEFKAHVSIGGVSNTSDDRCRAHGVGDAVFAGKLVEAADGVGYHVLDKEAG
jgi:hypothetical protein